MNAVIAGGSGGIGGAPVDRLLARQRGRPGDCHLPPPRTHPKLSWQRLDLTDEGAIASWCEQLPEIDRLINAAGVLHVTGQGPEKSIG